MKSFSSWLWGDKLLDRIIRWALMAVFVGIVCFFVSISLNNYNYEDTKSDNKDTEFNINFLKSLKDRL